MEELDDWGSDDIRAALTGVTLKSTKTLAEISEELPIKTDDSFPLLTAADEKAPETVVDPKLTRKKIVPKWKKEVVKKTREEREVQVPSMKSAVLDVMKLAVTAGKLNEKEKDNLNLHLALQLGAKAPKKKAINYKELKKIRKVEKAVEREEKLKLALSGVKKKISKRKIKKKKR